MGTAFSVIYNNILMNLFMNPHKFHSAERNETNHSNRQINYKCAFYSKNDINYTCLVCSPEGTNDYILPCCVSKNILFDFIH